MQSLLQSTGEEEATVKMSRLPPTPQQQVTQIILKKIILTLTCRVQQYWLRQFPSKLKQCELSRRLFSEGISL